MEMSQESTGSVGRLEWGGGWGVGAEEERAGEDGREWGGWQLLYSSQPA